VWRRLSHRAAESLAVRDANVRGQCGHGHRLYVSLTRAAANIYANDASHTRADSDANSCACDAHANSNPCANCAGISHHGGTRSAVRMAIL
jgi:hypothetical protein